MDNLPAVIPSNDVALSPDLVHAGPRLRPRQWCLGKGLAPLPADPCRAPGMIRMCCLAATEISICSISATVAVKRSAAPGSPSISGWRPSAGRVSSFAASSRLARTSRRIPNALSFASNFVRNEFHWTHFSVPACSLDVDICQIALDTDDRADLPAVGARAFGRRLKTRSTSGKWWHHQWHGLRSLT
jgi:hypothetical protein